jgi:GT2 family glycosyltransferase
MPDIVAVIVNYNGLPFVLDAVNSLRAQTVAPAEIVVVDNGSTDGSIEALRTVPTITLIEAGENLGFAEGCNLAVRSSSAPYIALLNPDATADSRWLETLSRVLDSDKSVAAAGGKIYFKESMPYIDQAGAYFNNLGNYWGRGFMQADAGQFETEQEVAGITACAMLLRREALDGDPLFDPAIFMYGEELDLTLRIRARGHRIVYSPHAIAYHRGMHSVRRTNEQPRLFQQFHSNRNRARILLKYYPWTILSRNAHLIAMSFAYWSWVFMVRGGPLFFMRAFAAQLRGAAAGLRQRDRVVVRAAPVWLPWMTHQSLRDLLAQKETMESVD